MKEEDGPPPSLLLRLAAVSKGPASSQHCPGHFAYLTQSPVVITPVRKGSSILLLMRILELREAKQCPGGHTAHKQQN